MGRGHLDPHGLTRCAGRPRDFLTARLRHDNLGAHVSDKFPTEMFRAVGTSGTMDYLGLLGDVPVKYWTRGNFDYSRVSGNLMAEMIKREPQNDFLKNVDSNVSNGDCS